MSELLNDVEKECESWIGIDLGTCNTVVSEFSEGKPTAIQLMGRSEIIPSAVLYKGPDDFYFGSDALNRGVLKAESVATIFKTHIADENYKYNIKYANSTSEAEEENYNDTLFIIDTEAFYANEYILDVINYDEFSGKICIPDYVESELHDAVLKGESAGKVRAALDNISKIKETSFYKVIEPTPADVGECSTMTDKQKFCYSAMKKFSECILVSADGALRSELVYSSPELEMRIWTADEFSVNMKPRSITDDGYIEVTAFEVAVAFLRNIKKLASEYKHTSVNSVVITVPVSFDIKEIEAVKKACTAAGFSRVETELEPIAAGIRYFYNQLFDQQKHILVYDFGGGTFDTTIIRITPDPSSIFGAEYQVIGKSGDHHLGGDDITKLIVKEIYDNLLSDYDINMNSAEDFGSSKEEYVVNKNIIYKNCEDCKIALSSALDMYYITFNLKKDGKVIEYSREFHKEQFENLIRLNIIGRVKEKLDEVLNTNYLGLTKSDIDDIILVGGTSGIGILKEHLSDYFGKRPSNAGDPAKLVSEGAAMESFMYSERAGIMNAEELERRNSIVKDALKTYGVGLHDCVFDTLIEKTTELPCSITKEYAISRDNPRKIEFSVYSTSLTEIPNSVIVEGVDHVGTIQVNELPSGLSMNDTIVEITVTLNQDYTMSVEAYLKHKDGTPIGGGKSEKAEIKAV